ncbi:MAG: argininosuccinate synthase [Dehalococcoidia bacterium]
MPVALDGEALAPVDLVNRVQELAGRHGIGRIDQIENRLVGIKSREIYEAKAVTLLAAHRAIEALTLSKQQLRFKARVAQEYADLIYNGLWFSAHHQDLAGYVQSSQRHVTGDVRMKLWHGTAVAAGQRSDFSLYSHARNVRVRRPVRSDGGAGVHQAVGPARRGAGAGAAPA